ncbi:MAG: hypothetical protein RLY83_309 [Actinomycetota bacterium]|jgi:hypothetical protein
MKTNAKLFWLLTAFYALATAGYALVGLWEPYNGLAVGGPSLGTLKVEIIGTAALAMLSLMSAFIAFYLGKTSRSQGPVPEDNPQAKISDGESEIGFFNAWSWWPFFLGLFAAIVFASLAVGWWLFIIGFPLAIVALVGFVFENSRGQYAH